MIATHLAAIIRAQHHGWPHPDGHRECRICQASWPCNPTYAADAIDRQAQEIRALNARIVELTTGPCDLGPCALAAGHTGRCEL